MNVPTKTHGTTRAQSRPSGRRRADGPAATDPTIVRDVAATALALLAVTWGLFLGAVLPVGTSAVVFAMTAGGAWAAWPGLVALAPALLGGAR